MDRLVENKIVFSGNNNEVDKFTSQKQPEMYYEGQIVNDQAEKEEQKGEEVIVKDEKIGCNKAVYNMFF